MYQNTWTKDLEGGIMTLDMTLDLTSKNASKSRNHSDTYCSTFEKASQYGLEAQSIAFFNTPGTE